MSSATYILHTSTCGPYLLLPSSSGAAYAGLPHCVTQYARAVDPTSATSFIRTTLLSPKSAREGLNSLCKLAITVEPHYYDHPQDWATLT